MIRSFYPQSVARHGLWATVRHFEHNRNRAHREMLGGNDGRAGSSKGYIPSGRFFQNLVQQTFGVERMRAILPGIAHGTRDRYLGARRHWVGFTNGHKKSHWVARSNFNWDGDLVDFMLPESKMMGNAAPTIASKVSAVRFWHVISGYPDFSVGGGRFRFVWNGLMRDYKVERKQPVTFEMLS